MVRIWLGDTRPQPRSSILRRGGQRKQPSRVALLTLTSVACADSSTAASSSNTLVYSSSVCGCGLAAASVAKKASMSSGLHRAGGSVLPGAPGVAARARQGGFDDRALALQHGRVGVLAVGPPGRPAWPALAASRSSFFARSRSHAKRWKA
jgi:hypothetical protein